MEEFSGDRAKLYRECLRQFPDSRNEDIEIMKKYLKPKYGETILEIGAGNGFFSGQIAKSLGNKGKLIVLDPSLEQLDGVKELGANIDVLNARAENINLKEDSIDAIWSFGAMHHVFEKSKSFEKFYKILRKGGRIVIGDVFSGSKLAKHFDEQVAKYCITGHEVAFWSDEYADSLCYLHRLRKPEIKKINQKWWFDSKKDLGIFLYKIHAMTKTNPEECLKGAERILGIGKKGDKFYLNWPMKIIITGK